MTNNSTGKRSLQGHTVLSLALAVILVPASAGLAMADDRDRGHDGDQAWRAHEVHAYRHFHRPHGVVVEPAPVVYAPPVIYAPPPQPEGINLIIPLHIN